VFRAADLNRVKQLMTGTAIIDGRNIYNPNDVTDCGLEYFSVGRLSRTQKKHTLKMRPSKIQHALTTAL
jgi:hypothetical protein